MSSVHGGHYLAERRVCLGRTTFVSRTRDPQKTSTALRSTQVLATVGLLDASVALARAEVTDLAVLARTI
jgi:hypothetical protein